MEIISHFEAMDFKKPSTSTARRTPCLIIETFLNILVIALILPVAANGKCRIPKNYHGEWFSMEKGNELNTVITAERWGINSIRNYEISSMVCEELYVHPSQSIQGDGGNYVTMLMSNSNGDSQQTCYHCVEVLWRTPNVLQYQKGDCLRAQSGLNIRLSDLCSPQHRQPSNDETDTLYRTLPQTVNCKDTFEGIYQFAYEMNYGGGGICNNSNSQIKACQDFGSPYIENQVFDMTYNKCPEVSTSLYSGVSHQNVLSPCGFKCECCDGCGGDDGCCGGDSVNDNNSLDGHSVHRRGCGWSFCFIITDDGCCDNEDNRRRRNQRRYELERRRQMESQGPNVTGTVNGGPGNQGLPATSDQEPNIDNAQSPTAITTQPPSYEEATQEDPVVTSQPV